MGNWITMFENNYLKKLLVSKDAKHDLTILLNKAPTNEHFARLYGPTMMVEQDRIQSFRVRVGSGSSQDGSKGPKELTQLESAEPGPGKKQTWKKFITRHREELVTDYEKDQNALTLAFAYNMFDNERTKKFRRNYDQDDHEDQMGKMFERKTNFFVDVALQAAEYEQIQRPETVTTRRTRTNTE